MTALPKHLINSPSCSHAPENGTVASARPRCARPTPGAASGGCAFDGAQVVLYPVADAAHLVHGPIGCTALNWNNRGSKSDYGDFHRLGFTTDLQEIDIVMGGEAKLMQAARELVARYTPKALFLYNTCVGAMIGDDLSQVAKQLGQELAIPVIPVDSPGFVGSKNYGNKLAGEALLQHVIGTSEPAHTTTTDICLIGEYNIAGELEAIEPLLRESGIRLLSRLTGNASFQELTWAHRARASMVVCSQALIKLAEQMHERYGIPFFEGSFYGFGATAAALRTFGTLLGDASVQEQIEMTIARNEAAAREALAPYLPALAGKRVFLYSGGVKSWSMVAQLEELGMEVIGTSTRKSTEADIARIRQQFEGTQKILMEKGDGKAILDIIEREGADMLLAGGRNLYTAIKGKIPFVDVNQERLFAYAGYTGQVELARRLHATLTSPVWDLAKTAPCWEVRS